MTAQILDFSTGKPIRQRRPDPVTQIATPFTDEQIDRLITDAFKSGMQCDFACITDDPDNGGVLLDVHFSVPPGAATSIEQHFDSYAQALAHSINHYGIIQPFDCRGPDGAGYYG